MAKREKGVKTFEEFLATAKRKKCEEVVLGLACYQEQRPSGFSEKTVAVFEVRCTAYKDSEEIVRFTRHLLTYELHASTKKERKQEMKKYREASRKNMEKMKKKIHTTFPSAVTKRIPPSKRL